jgi:hypothetical protein
MVEGEPAYSNSAFYLTGRKMAPFKGEERKKAPV